MSLHRLVGLGALLLFAVGAHAFPNGKSAFDFDDGRGHKINVLVYQPTKYDKNSPIQFVMHGMSRNAVQSRENWIALAEREQVLIVAPHFDGKQFKRTDDYTLGAIRDGQRTLDSLTAIEKLFDQIRRNTGSNRTDYRIFGHSAGAQFVQRLILLRPESRAEWAIAANAGRYTWPEWRAEKRAVALPNGLLNVEDAESKLKTALEKNLIIMVGEADNDSNHPQLTHGKEIDRQGLERFSRGQNFFKASVDAASEMKVISRWTIKSVPGVGHDNAAMAQAAIKLMYRSDLKS